MAQQLRALAALAEAPSVVPSPLIGWSMTNAASRGSDVLSRASVVTCRHMTHTQTARHTGIDANKHQKFTSVSFPIPRESAAPCLP